MKKLMVEYLKEYRYSQGRVRKRIEFIRNKVASEFQTALAYLDAEIM